MDPVTVVENSGGENPGGENPGGEKVNVAFDAHPEKDPGHFKPPPPTKESLTVVENPVGENPGGEKVNGAFDAHPEKDLGHFKPPPPPQDPEKPQAAARQKWDNPTEFLMSCIATAVGLGNVWRFPFVAYNNGGGAFLIPYIIVLIVIGRPMYYLETILGQFSSSNCIKIWALSPALKGTGYAQALGATYVLSYYVSIIALCLYYLAMSFQTTLPWALCDESWGDNCLPSVGVPNDQFAANISSAELYFTRTVLRMSDGIDDGIGAPLWDLTLCLLASWLIIFVIVVRGVKSSGKAAYFLALFPYIMLFILFIRAVTLPGAGDGILFFLTPDWSKLIQLSVWYNAVTQAFFSLSVCSGALIMFSSYNEFNTNVYRYANIVTTLDTFTSLLSGITIFGILGNLAYELGVDDVSQVIHGAGTSLAFISYPDAIAKTPFAPQLFAVLFFLMMAVLGVGSGVALLSTVNTVLLDSFPRVGVTYMSAITCSVSFLIGLVYVTPGGQYILELVDYYGGTFMRLFAAIFEAIGVFWIYGLENVCLDVEFMLGIKTGFYWRICWGILTPVLLISVFIYALVVPSTFGGDPSDPSVYQYPEGALIAGECLQYLGMIMIPIFVIIALWKYRSNGVIETVKKSFSKKPTYGPRDDDKHEEYKAFRSEAKMDRALVRRGWLHHVGSSLVGAYRWKH